MLDTQDSIICGSKLTKAWVQKLASVLKEKCWPASRNRRKTHCRVYFGAIKNPGRTNNGCLQIIKYYCLPMRIQHTCAVFQLLILLILKLHFALLANMWRTLCDGFVDLVEQPTYSNV